MAFSLSGLISDMLSSNRVGTRRIKFEQGRAGLDEGRQFRFNRKLTAPTVLRFNAVTPFLLFKQEFAVYDGDYEFFAWRADNVTPSGVWTELPTFAENTVNTVYQKQNKVETGGSIVVTNPAQYTDYARLLTATASGQRVSAGLNEGDERVLLPEIYYLQFTGTAALRYAISWEEQ